MTSKIDEQAASYNLMSTNKNAEITVRKIFIALKLMIVVMLEFIAEIAQLWKSKIGMTKFIIFTIVNFNFG